MVDTECFISTELAWLDLELIHYFLSEHSYWARGIPRDVVARSIANSLCFGVYASGKGALDPGRRQVGFARVTTDRATFAYLADVFILPGHRGQGLSKRLMEAVLAHQDLQGLRRWMLATADAHELYRRFGFAELSQPDRFMQRHDPDVYTKNGAG
ncbi:MAG TPA: GNAT family N-acetyltransferase [Chthoniobacterales bacterium]